MRYLFLFLLLLFFSIDVTANEQNSIKQQYDLAFKEYKKGNFNKSYKIFSKIYMQRLSDVKLNFYFGYSAYQTGHYRMALAAFERVDMLDPKNLRNKLAMARTYYMLKMYKDAQNTFKEVLASPNLPKDLRTHIELALSLVSKVQQHSFTYAKIMINALYDSNVNYGSIGDYQYGGRVFPRIENISDNAIEAYGNLTNIYDIGIQGDFAIKNSISFYMKDYNNQDMYDLQYIVYKPSLLFKKSHSLVDISAGVDLMTIQKKNYLKTIFFEPKFEYAHTATLKSIFSAKYQRKDFTQTLTNDRDANRYEFLYGVQKILSPHSLIQIDANAIYERKIRGEDIYVNFNEYKLKMTYVNQLTNVWSINSFIQIRDRAYTDYSTQFGSKRSDTGGLANLSIGAKFLPTFSVNIKGSYEYVVSNQDRFTYKKHTISFGIIKTF